MTRFDPPSATAQETPSLQQGDRTRMSLGAQVERLAVPGILVLLVIGFSITIPTFRTTGNFESMINSQSVILMLALTAAITLRSGVFDLSIAQVMVASGAIVAVMTSDGTSLPVAIAVALLFGAVVGCVHGVLIVKIGVDSFITTLGTLTALTGFTYAVTDSQIVAGLPDSLTELSRSGFIGIPLATWYAWIGVLILWFVFERTPIGRYLLFIGGSEPAARLAGLPVTRIRFGTFIASSCMAALTGVVLVGQLGAVDPAMGSMYLLPPFAAVFLGSTAFTPGRFNALGAMTAVYLLVVGITGLQLLGVSSWVSSVFNGLALVAAVTLAKLANRGAR